MKRLIPALLGLALFPLSSITAKAQLSTPFSTAGYIIPATTISNLATPVLIDIRRQQSVALLCTSKQHSGTDTANVGFRFVPSVDGSTKADAPLIWVVRAANGGTTALNVTTNIAASVISGYPYLILDQITNGNSTITTNLSVKYWVKPNAP